MTGGPPGLRLGIDPGPRTPGVRVVLDVRPLQAPERAPVAAAYLDGLLTAYDRDPADGESFVWLLAAGLADPTTRFENLDAAGSRQLPPTRLLRAGALTVDPFILRSAAFGTAWRADRRGASGAVYHAVGSGPLPIASGLPVVITLLDLAPWELPKAFGRSAANRFGQRLRTRMLREATAVIVGSEATALAARRLLRVRRDRLHVIRLAPRAGFGLPSSDPGPERDGAFRERDGALRERLGLESRYFILPGRFDARLDLRTFLSAMADLAAAGRPANLDQGTAWPPRILVVGASPDDRASIARAAARKGIGESLAYAPALAVEELVGLVQGARAVVLPAISEGAGLPIIEALACGVPVIASSVGPLPELVGPAGLLVEPADPARLAVALATLWADDVVHGRLREVARASATEASSNLVGCRRGDASDLCGGRDRPGQARPLSDQPAVGLALGTGVPGGVFFPALKVAG